MAGDVSRERRRSLARRASYLLAVVGFIGYWGTTWVVLSGGSIAQANDRISLGGNAVLAAGVAFLLALAAHVVGLGLAFAAPRGERLLPGLLNGISLAIQIATIVAGMTIAG